MLDTFLLIESCNRFEYLQRKKKSTRLSKVKNASMHSLPVYFSAACCHCMIFFKSLNVTSFSKVSFIIRWNSKSRKAHIVARCEAASCEFEDFVSAAGTAQPVQMCVWGCVCTCFCVFMCVCVCVYVFLSIRGRKCAIAAACLFSLAIFSCWPCQGPHQPPTHSGQQWPSV